MRITLSALLLASLVAIAAAPAGAQPEFYYVAQYSRHVASEVYLIDHYGAILMIAARLPLTHVPVSLVQDDANSGFYILGNSLGTPPRGFAPNLSAWAAAIHPPSGRILVRGHTKTPPLEFGYFFVDPNTGAWTRVATSSTLVYTAVGSREPVYDASFDGFWDNPLDFNSRTGMVLRVNRQFGLTTFARHPGLVPVSLEPGSGRGFARPFRALMTPTLVTPPAPFALFAMDRAGVLTTLGTLPGSGNLWSRSELLRHGRRPGSVRLRLRARRCRAVRERAQGHALRRRRSDPGPAGVLEHRHRL